MKTAVVDSDQVSGKSGQLSANTARIVLLGLAGAGKSSLLGALARCSEIQERILDGRLTDLTASLRGLQQQVDQAGTTGHAAELATYPIRFEPFTNGRPDSSRSSKLVLTDPDGHSASELISQQTDGTVSWRSGGLGEQVSLADAVILVLDASAPDTQIDAASNQFLEYLRRFRRRRGHDTDVSDLPVFLVMTKCDLLARPGDTLAVWTERMEARKEESIQRFEEFLREHNEPSFGSIAFTPASTAIHYPNLTNLQSRADEPFGVAELFRQVLSAAC